MSNNKGFTLIELMIVVAIIGILAAIAIPNFIAMQLRAKRAELPTNLDGLRTAEKAYHAEWSKFTDAGPMPAATPSGRDAVDFGSAPKFKLLGWVADGQVRGAYAVTAANSSSGSQDDDFDASAASDVDGDGSEASYLCNRALKAYMNTDNDVY